MQKKYFKNTQDLVKLHDTTVISINNIILKENYEFVSLTRAKK